jgi:hypothetical protein
VSGEKDSCGGPGLAKVLARRSPRDPRTISYYFSYALTETTPAVLVTATHAALDHLGLLPTRQGRFLTRSLRGALLARLASSYEPGHGGGPLPVPDCRLSAQRRLWKTERNESGARERSG